MPSSTRSAWIAVLLQPALHVLADGPVVLDDQDLHVSPRNGQEDPEGAARARLALHLDPAAMLLHDAVADRQAEAGAAPRRLGGVERLEDLGQLGARDPVPGVLDLHHDLVGAVAGCAASAR